MTNHNFFYRAPCKRQVFADVQCAENFVRFMYQKGIKRYTVEHLPCERCKRVHVKENLTTALWRR